jgi:hypothetical protein
MYLCGYIVVSSVDVALSIKTKPALHGEFQVGTAHTTATRATQTRNYYLTRNEEKRYEPTPVMSSQKTGRNNAIEDEQNHLDPHLYMQYRLIISTEQDRK